jgi:hypothetical protein
MTSKLDVSIPAEIGISLHGWLFVPDRQGPHPALTTAHGFGDLIHHGWNHLPARSTRRVSRVSRMAAEALRADGYQTECEAEAVQCANDKN